MFGLLLKVITTIELNAIKLKVLMTCFFEYIFSQRCYIWSCLKKAIKIFFINILSLLRWSLGKKIYILNTTYVSRSLKRAYKHKSCTRLRSHEHSQFQFQRHYALRERWWVAIWNSVRQSRRRHGRLAAATFNLINFNIFEWIISPWPRPIFRSSAPSTP